MTTWKQNPSVFFPTYFIPSHLKSTFLVLKKKSLLEIHRITSSSSISEKSRLLTRLQVHWCVTIHHPICHICVLQSKNYWRLELKLFLNFLQAALHLRGTYIVKMPLCFLNDTVWKKRATQVEHSHQNGCLVTFA